MGLTNLLLLFIVILLFKISGDLRRWRSGVVEEDPGKFHADYAAYLKKQKGISCQFPVPWLIVERFISASNNASSAPHRQGSIPHHQGAIL